MPLMFLITIIKAKAMVIIFILLTALIKAKLCPAINNYILTNSADNKAFNMSINSLINNAISALLMVSLSRIVYRVGFNNTMIVLSILTLVLNIYLYNKYLKKCKMALLEG